MPTCALVLLLYTSTTCATHKGCSRRAAAVAAAAILSTDGGHKIILSRPLPAPRRPQPRPRGLRGRQEVLEKPPPQQFHQREPGPHMRSVCATGATPKERRTRRSGLWASTAAQCIYCMFQEATDKSRKAYAHLKGVTPPFNANFTIQVVAAKSARMHELEEEDLRFDGAKQLLRLLGITIMRCCFLAT